MLDWLREFATKYGAAGIQSLALLVLSVVALQNTRILPSAHGDAIVAAQQASDAASAVEKATKSMDAHIEQARQQTEEQKRTNWKLDQMQKSNSHGLRIICMTQAKTSADRIECAKIE